ncbi:MAG: aminotransferase class III-fold pyridoxal phosphate-dependent enzyme [Bacteroidales bacterium]
MHLHSTQEIKELYNRLHQLTAEPVRRIRRDAMEQYLQHFENKCSASKSLIAEAREAIPGGVQHNLAFNHPFPLVFTRAEGAWLEDLDGNRYIDFLQAGGPTVLGSNHPAVREKIIELLNTCGPSTGLFHEYEFKLASLVKRLIPSVEMFRMLGSGTEAVMAAVRLARLATGKKKIIKCGGAYHGWSDQMVYGMRIPGTGRFDAHGIPRPLTRYTQEVFPNDLHALERQLRLNRIRGGTAAVILEPAGTESGTRPVDPEYNKGVRSLCDRYGTLLIFDEVVTAFRLSMHGAQHIYGVKPDITVFGKVIAGGYPGAGGVGGRRELMQLMTAGVQSGNKKIMVGGTMAANPLSSAAGYYTLLEMEKQQACEKASNAGDQLTAGLLDLIGKYKLPFVAYNQGSICHLETTGTMFIPLNYFRIFKVLEEIKKRKHVMEEMGAAYMAEGIVTLAGSRMYTSMADTPEVISLALERFEKVFQKISQGEEIGTGS